MMMRGVGIAALVLGTAFAARQIIVVGGPPKPLPGPAAENVIAAASCAQADVQTAITAASSGMTVTVPSGSCTWTGQLTSSGKSLTILGAGVDVTVITDNSSSNPVWSMTCPASGQLRLSAFSVVSSISNQSGKYFLDVLSCPTLRIDHIKITGYANNRSPWMHTNNSFGVIDHITWEGGFNEFLLVGHTAWGGVGSFGDNSWASATDLGSANAIYIEDSTFTSTGTPQDIIEANGEGGRYVARFNTIQHYYLGGHGTESPGRPRGVRQVEAYFNAFVVLVGQSLDRATQLRSGTGLIFKNTISRPGGTPGFNMWLKLWTVRRADSAGGWGACDGTGQWDENDTTGGPGGDGIYVTGTATSGTTTDSLFDSTKDFTTACNGGSCLGYALRDLTLGRSSRIRTVASATNITTLATSLSGPHTYASGDSYEIRRAITCLDQPGRGQSAVLLSGNPAVPTGWVQNALEPVYVWGNTGGTPSNSAVVAQSNDLVANLDYYVNGASFTGATGVGEGTIGARPATCTTGVAYWATDEGEWNSTNGATADGKMYVCTATNTWTARYGATGANATGVPYVYPHPLNQ